MCIWVHRCPGGCRAVRHSPRVPGFLISFLLCVPCLTYFPALVLLSWELAQASFFSLDTHLAHILQDPHEDEPHLCPESFEISPPTWIRLANILVIWIVSVWTLSLINGYSHLPGYSHFPGLLPSSWLVPSPWYFHLPGYSHLPSNLQSYVELLVGAIQNITTFRESFKKL